MCIDLPPKSMLNIAAIDAHYVQIKTDSYSDNIVTRKAVGACDIAAK